MSKTLPLSEHFTVHELAQGVWATVVIPEGLAASNSGIVDLGDRTLVFDTTLSASAAADLRTAAERLTGRSVGAVLTSHWHGDHVHGNCVFDAQTPIYATPRTKVIMAERTAARLAERRASWPDQLKKWEEELKTAADEATRKELTESVAFARRVIADLSKIEVRLPDHTFTDRMEFKGPRRAVEFLTYGGGHTDSDAFLYLPAERIAFMGDLVVVKNHPWLGDGHPHDWLAILDRVQKLEITAVVPGHGPLGTLEDAKRIQQYLSQALQRAEQNIKEGGDAEKAAQLPAPALAQGWANADGFGRNMRFLHEYVEKKNS